MERLNYFELEEDISEFIMSRFWRLNALGQHAYSRRVWSNLAHILQTRLMCENVKPTLRNALQLDKSQIISLPGLGNKALAAWESLLENYALSYKMDDESIEEHVHPTTHKPLSVRTAVDYLISQGYIVSLSKDLDHDHDKESIL